VLNILINESPFRVIVYTSYTVLKMIRFLWPTW